jgi:nucleoside-diphosphate-sugar epimerase
MGVNAEIICDAKRIRPEASEVMQLISCTDKVRALTTWQPKTSLREGLTKTIAFISNHINLYKPEIYNV